MAKHPSVTRESLQEVGKGHRLTADEWNAVVRTVKANIISADAMVTSAASAQVLQPIAPDIPHPVRLTSARNLEPHSVFTITGKGTNVASHGTVLPQNLKVVPAEDATPFSGLTWATNGSMWVKAGQCFIGELITPGRPVKLRMAAPGAGIGMPCGVSLLASMLTAERLGFVCLSKTVDNMATAVLDTGFFACIGELTTSLPAFTCNTRTLGSGTMAIVRRKAASAVTRVAISPDSSLPFEIPIYNFTAFGGSVGDLVQAVAVYGVGMVLFQDGKTCVSTSWNPSESPPSSSAASLSTTSSSSETPPTSSSSEAPPSSVSSSSSSSEADTLTVVTGISCGTNGCFTVTSREITLPVGTTVGPPSSHICCPDTSLSSSSAAPSSSTSLSTSCRATWSKTITIEDTTSSTSEAPHVVTVIIGFDSTNPHVGEGVPGDYLGSDDFETCSVPLYIEMTDDSGVLNEVELQVETETLYNDDVTTASYSTFNANVAPQSPWTMVSETDWV